MLTRNDLPTIDAVLPNRRSDGDATVRYLNADTVASVIDGIRHAGSDAEIRRISARTRVATDESIDSEHVPWADVAAAGLPVHGSKP